MNGWQRKRSLLAGVALGLSVGGPTLAGWMELDPGVTEVRTARPAVMRDVTIEPGAWGRLDMTLGEYRVEVVSGEVSVVSTAERVTVSAGEIRVIPAGTAFGLLNSGAGPAHLMISVLALQRVGP